MKFKIIYLYFNNKSLKYYLEALIVNNYFNLKL